MKFDLKDSNVFSNDLQTHQNFVEASVLLNVAISHVTMYLDKCSFYLQKTFKEE